jgi:hypothetical protein
MNEEQTQELDRILKLWADSYQNQTNFQLAGCMHEPRYYVGFREEYEFCLKCDSKRIDGTWVEKA